MPLLSLGAKLAALKLLEDFEDLGFGRFDEPIQASGLQTHT